MKLETTQESRRDFKKILLILLFLLVAWFVLTWDCVKGRAKSGIQINWAEIKDCSY